MQRETKAQRDERVNRILALLDEEYGTDYRCYLNHETPWQLLIAVITVSYTHLNPAGMNCCGDRLHSLECAAVLSS